MINQSMKKEILKTIEISKETAKNNLDITIDCYTELLSRLEMLTYLIMSEDKKQLQSIMKISFFKKIMII